MTPNPPPTRFVLVYQEDEMITPAHLDAIISVFETKSNPANLQIFFDESVKNMDQPDSVTGSLLSFLPEETRKRFIEERKGRLIRELAERQQRDAELLLRLRLMRLLLAKPKATRLPVPGWMLMASDKSTPRLYVPWGFEPTPTFALAVAWLKDHVDCKLLIDPATYSFADPDSYTPVAEGESAHYYIMHQRDS